MEIPSLPPPKKIEIETLLFIIEKIINLIIIIIIIIIHGFVGSNIKKKLHSIKKDSNILKINLSEFPEGEYLNLYPLSSDAIQI
jgi:hypothetical protein